MKKFSIFNFLSFGLVLIFGCSSPQFKFKPIGTVDAGSKFCVVSESSKHEGGEVLDLIETWLVDHGFKVKHLDSLSQIESCEWSLGYYSINRWDISVFLSQAKIKAYKNGESFGYVEYSASNNFNTKKFTKRAVTVNKMMSSLFGEKERELEKPVRDNSTENY